MIPGVGVGRIVHYSSGTGECFAGIITKILNEEMVALRVFFPNGSDVSTPAIYSDDRAAGTWHWPEKV